MLVGWSVNGPWTCDRVLSEKWVLAHPTTPGCRPIRSGFVAATHSFTQASTFVSPCQFASAVSFGQPDRDPQVPRGGVLLAL